MKGLLPKFLKKKRRFFLHIVLFASISFLLSIAIFDLVLRQYIFDKKLNEFPLDTSLTQYPAFKSPIDPLVTAKGVVVMDKDSKVILFSKNPNLLFSMASTAKIMTALVALDYYKMDDALTIKTENVEGANVGFKIGQKFFFKDLLYGMLLPSGNDASLAIAENYPGGEKLFVEKMNEKARSLNLKNTNFADSIGLVDSQDFTTPLDLATLSGIAMDNKTFSKIVSTKDMIFSDVTGYSYQVFNLNKLLGFRGVNGVKTGTTIEAGQVLVTSKIENGHTIIIVVMDSIDRFSDTSILLNAISGNINYLSIRP